MVYLRSWSFTALDMDVYLKVTFCLVTAGVLRRVKDLRFFLDFYLLRLLRTYL